MSKTLTLVIGNKRYSSWSLRAWLFLKHAGVAFDEHRIPLDTEQWRREIHHHSPSGRVPVLKHGELTVWDTLAICEYVNETFIAGRGWPRDPEARAVARAVSAEMHSGFPSLRARLPLNCCRRFRGFRVPEEAVHEVARILEIWRGCLGRYAGNGPWLFGEFCIADAMFAPVALRFHGYDVSITGEEADYVATVLADPAIGEWIRAAARESEVIEAEEIAHPHEAFV